MPSLMCMPRRRIDKLPKDACPFEGLPRPFFLREPVGHREEYNRVYAQSAMAAVNLYIISQTVFGFDAILPSDDAIFLGEDRS